MSMYIIIHVKGKHIHAYMCASYIFVYISRKELRQTIKH